MDRPAASQPELSVVIPFYNEEANVARVLAELRETMEKLGLHVEVLAVNDGSRDRTGPEIDAAARAWPAVRPIHFVKNSGQAAALYHGFHEARGTYLAMLDGDGQNPPSELARLWEQRASADMIAGARAKRRDSTLRRLMSRTANGVRRLLLRDGVTDTGCSLKVFRREVARSFIPLRTMYSFLPAFAVSAGFTVKQVFVEHRPRTAGESKYGFGVMAIHPMLDMLALCWLLRRTVRQAGRVTTEKAP